MYDWLVFAWVRFDQLGAWPASVPFRPRTYSCVCFACDDFRCTHSFGRALLLRLFQTQIHMRVSWLRARSVWLELADPRMRAVYFAAWTILITATSPLPRLSPRDFRIGSLLLSPRHRKKAAIPSQRKCTRTPAPRLHSSWCKQERLYPLRLREQQRERVLLFPSLESMVFVLRTWHLMKYEPTINKWINVIYNS